MDRESNRRFIVVQLPEPTRRKKPDGKYKETAAYKAGYKNTSGWRRSQIWRVIQRLKEEAGEAAISGTKKQPDGFKVFKLASPTSNNGLRTRIAIPDVHAEKLSLFNDPFKRWLET